MNKIELIQSANGHLSNGDTEKACLIFRKAYELDPRCGHTLLAYLKAAVRGGRDYAEIDTTIQTLASIGEGFSSAGLLYYDCSLENGRLSFAQRISEFSKTWHAFHTGSEVDWLFWKIAGNEIALKPESLSSLPELAIESIPRNIFYYFDKQELPEDVRLNIDPPASHKLFNIILFNKTSGRSFLVREYGVETAMLFDALRHPSEESDFIRFHAVYKYGGYWSDVDEKLDYALFAKFLNNAAYPRLLLSQSQSEGGPLQSCFFGGVAGHPILQRCLDLLYFNCIHHPSLSMWLKTGPGPLTRAVFEHYINSALDSKAEKQDFLKIRMAEDKTTITSAQTLRTFLFPYEPSYRNDDRDWRVFEANISSQQ